MKTQGRDEPGPWGLSSADVDEIAYMIEYACAYLCAQDGLTEPTHEMIVGCTVGAVRSFYKNRFSVSPLGKPVELGPMFEN